MFVLQKTSNRNSNRDLPTSQIIKSAQKTYFQKFKMSQIDNMPTVNISNSCPILNLVCI